MLKKCDISNNNSQFRKCVLADVICCGKVTSFKALDGVTSFKRLKNVKIHVNKCNIVKVLAGALQCNGGKLEEAEYFKCVSFVYCVLETK